MLRRGRAFSRPHNLSRPMIFQAPNFFSFVGPWKILFTANMSKKIDRGNQYYRILKDWMNKVAIKCINYKRSGWKLEADGT